MEEETMFPIAVDHVIDTEYLIVIGDQVYSHSCRKLPGVDHGIGGIGEIVVYIAGVCKNIGIYRIMHLVELLHPQERNGKAVWLNHLDFKIIQGNYRNSF